MIAQSRPQVYLAVVLRVFCVTEKIITYSGYGTEQSSKRTVVLSQATTSSEGVKFTYPQV